MLILNKRFVLAPSEPRNVTVVTVTNTTIVIEWIKPNQTNGIIKYYTISYNGVSVNATPKNQDELKIEVSIRTVKAYQSRPEFQLILS